MNDQEMRLRALELAVKHRDQLVKECDQVADEPGAIFVIADKLFEYVCTGDHPDQESNGGNDGEKNN